MKSPAVTAHRWGSIEVEGFGGFKDAKLYPGGARSWDWNETGTRHEPGIQPEDVQELLDVGAEVVILGCGHHERLCVPKETVAWLEQRGVEVRVLPTPDAVGKYNELAETVAVAALLHSTC